MEEQHRALEKILIPKSRVACQYSPGGNVPVISSMDAGLIEYLKGFPGVYTKRWHSGTDRERNMALIEKLKGIPKEKRRINFVSFNNI